MLFTLTFNSTLSKFIVRRINIFNTYVLTCLTITLYILYTYNLISINCVYYSLPVLVLYSTYSLPIYTSLIYSITNVLVCTTIFQVNTIYSITLIICSLLSFMKFKFRNRVKLPYSWIGMWLNGKYYVDKLIAEGGFSYVFKVFDDFGKTYAVKLFKIDFSKLKELDLQKFKQEVSKYFLIQCNSIVKIYEVSIPKDNYSKLIEYLKKPPFLVMEYAEGGSLRTYLIKHGRLTFDEFIKVAYKIANAVYELHKFGFAHLDLKPENILFMDRKRRIVKICDLGAGQIVQHLGKSKINQFSKIYAAPEIKIQGEGSLSSDIYSLGCIFYEMIIGKPPISNIDLNINIPDDIKKLIINMLNPNPDKRPSIEFILEILRRYLTVRP